ncbi:winged helix-turn-helix domain-containing protein [Micromonospora maris]|uniref:Transcriptional regulator n=1 Tax=Micromonospora maris TaxID=1003110 RepID=A0A9X0HZF7_9ACTN|nr:winged helix-turn-helix domain-containing protein [Micromonospora maris]AEB44434.1 two component transcriptional regulator, winged helix family protein [Micromonospora maris AB-18-032]KUJ43957.1 transcriptional regulator [Micromonospora maris]
MRVVDVNRDVPVGEAEARRVGEVLTVTVHLRIGPGAHEHVDLFAALLALLGGDWPPASPSARDSGAHLRVHPQARAVYRGGAEIVLTRREYDLLWCLVANPRQVFTRAQLLDRVWGHPYASPRSVDVHVRRLRAKVGADLPVVTTLRGVGYRLGVDCSVEVVDDPASNWPIG